MPVPLFAHKPERCPHGNSLAPGMPQKISWLPCICGPEVRLNASDAAELAEILQFLFGWLARDPGCLGASLADHAANRAYGTAQLRPDLDRFIFLLVGDYGGELFGAAPP